MRSLYALEHSIAVAAQRLVVIDVGQGVGRDPALGSMCPTVAEAQFPG